MPPTDDQLAVLNLNRTEFDALMAEKVTIEDDIRRAFEGLLNYNLPALINAQQRIHAKAVVINRQVDDWLLDDGYLVNPLDAFSVLGRQFPLKAPAKQYLIELAGVFYAQNT